MHGRARTIGRLVVCGSFYCVFRNTGRPHVLRFRSEHIDVILYSLNKIRQHCAHNNIALSLSLSLSPNHPLPVTAQRVCVCHAAIVRSWRLGYC